MELGRRRVVLPVDPADEINGDNGDVVGVWHQPKIPDAFAWTLADALPSSEAELDAAVVDISAAMRGDAAGLRRAVEQITSACASHGLFQVTGHGLEPALARAALDGAAEFFRLPLATKQRARRTPGKVTGYTAAHADRFTTNLPWKETLSFGYRDYPTDSSHVVVDYFTSTLGNDFKPLGEVFQDYCQSMKEVSLAIMELLGVSLGVGRSYCRDFFADGCSTMRCNYYPPCPEPERTLGTGPHCDPAALTLLLQDDTTVDGLQVLVGGEWRSVRPKPGALVVNIGDTFTALSNGRYKSCVHRAVVHRERARRSLAFFLCPRDDLVVRPPPRLAQPRRRYPDFTWADLARFTQRHYRADARTLDAFARWLDGPSTSQSPAANAQEPVVVAPSGKTQEGVQAHLI